MRPDRADVPADQPTAEMRSSREGPGDGDGSDNTNRRCSSSYHDESRPSGGREGAERPMRPLRQRPCPRRKNSESAFRLWSPEIGPGSFAGVQSFSEEKLREEAINWTTIGGVSEFLSKKPFRKLGEDKIDAPIAIPARFVAVWTRRTSLLREEAS